MPADAATATPERGLLDLSVALSKREITAGNQFALYVLVKNPFNKPIYVRRVHVSLPSELKIVQDTGAKEEIKKQQQTREAQTQAYNAERLRLADSLGKMKTEMERLEKLIDGAKSHGGLDEKYFKDLESALFFFTSEIRRTDERLRVLDQGTSNISIRSGKFQNLRVVSYLANIDVGSRDESESQPVIGTMEVYDPSALQEQLAQARSIELESSLPRGCALQPSCTDVYRAILDVKKSLIFSPSTYRLQFNVNFGFDRATPEIAGSTPDTGILINTISHELAIRPSVYSVIIGSALGGFFGAIARILQVHPSAGQPGAGFSLAEFSGAVALSAILSGVAIIFMARKSDAQSFVSVEDFWGGLLIGFLIGYTGTAFFSSLTGFAPDRLPAPPEAKVLR